jgi:RNA polymerase sigma factor (sigma-70 family)
MPKTMDDTEIAALIAKSKAGDRAAIAELFLIIKPQLGDWSARLLQRGPIGIDRPSDIAQEAALQAFDGLPSFNGSTAKELWGWLRTILEHRIAESSRDAGRQKRDATRAEPLRDSLLDTLPASQPSPSQEVSDAEQWRHLLGQVFHLPDAQRQAVVLCLYKRRTVQEAASELRCSRAAVVGLLQRAAAKLNEKLAPDETSPPDELDAAGKALLTFLERRDHRENVQRERFLAEHHNCRDQVAVMLDWLDSIEASRPTVVEPSG